MITLQENLLKITNLLPYYYQQDVLEYALYLKEKSKKSNDTDYLESMPEIADAIIAASKEKPEDCSKTLDW